MTLTSKQRAYLRSLAVTQEPILHVGKGGISDTLVKQAEDALTARELFKGRVLETAPGVSEGNRGRDRRSGWGTGGAGDRPLLCAVPGAARSSGHRAAAVKQAAGKG